MHGVAGGAIVSIAEKSDCLSSVGIESQHLLSNYPGSIEFKSTGVASNRSEYESYVY